MNTNIESLRQKFYANSPFDLASKNDDKYRDAIDETLGEPDLCSVCKGTGIAKMKHSECFYDCPHCRGNGTEPSENDVSVNELVDALFLAQRELREFYLPSQSEAMRVMNDIIKRLAKNQNGYITTKSEAKRV